MSTLFNKLFPGTSSSSNSDVGSMESLCSAINDLCREESASVGELAAELVRKNKDLFEKKPNDVEGFLLHCSPIVGSAAMVAAIKALFDVSASKNNETGTDRAVELLNHYVDENNFVGSHLKLVPEIIFPLLRNVGLYCLEKKNKPEIGQRIITKAFSSMYPRNVAGPKVITSAHSVLFACALKTKDYASVEPFIDVQIDDIANEMCVQDAPEEPTSRLAKKAAMASMGSIVPLTPYINPKFVLEYLYNGACLLIELKRFEDALFLLEICVGIPAFSLHDQHIEGYKKFVLLSLLLNGRVSEMVDKHTRTLKVKTPDYKQLSEIKYTRGGNVHTKVEELVNNVKEKLRKDGNLELAKYLIIEMKKKTILSLTKMFTSITLPEIEELSHLKTREQVTDLIEQLVEEHRIAVRVEGEMVFWSEQTPMLSKMEVENKIVVVDNLNQLLHDKNTMMKAGSGRLRPSVMYNEDEGLSMPPIE